MFPSGMIKFNPAITQQATSIDEILALFDTDAQTTFVFEKEFPSLLNNNKVFVKYKQFFKGIEVLGGGITIQLSYNDDDNPCDDVYYLVSPNIYTGIQISEVPTFSNSQASAAVNAESTHSSKLVYFPDTDCTNHLIRRVNFERNNQSRLAYVDAHTGEVSLDKPTDFNLSAETYTYGIRDLDDSSTLNGNVVLSSTDSPTQVNTFDFGSSSVSTTGDFTNINPHSETGFWTDEEYLYQAHFATVEALKAFESLGINFGTVNVGVTTNEASPANLPGSTLNTTFLRFSPFGSSVDCDYQENDRRATSLIDIAGHELGHTVTNEIFSGINLTGDLTIKEAVSDMIGEYAEEVFRGFPDWVVGGDEEAVACVANRNLQNPGNFGNLTFAGCFTNAEEFNDTHRRGLPLGHWFHLASSTNGLGLRGTLLTVLDALLLVPDAGDAPEVRDAVMMILESEFSGCDDAIVFSAWAWNDVCLPVEGYDTCVKITGPHAVCEEYNYAQFSIINPLPNVVYRWSFPFDWTVPGRIPGTNAYEGQYLTVMGFDTENYYPWHHYVSAKNITSGTGSGYHNIRLDDCDGDDPSCEDLPSFYIRPEEEQSEIDIEKTKADSSDKTEFVKVFDLQGRLLYQGNELQNFLHTSPSKNTIVIIIWQDDNGNITKTEKFPIF